MIRTARCVCGALSVRTEGEPEAVVACHCTECQRRTGSVFGVGAYFAHGQVAISGAASSFLREVEGRPFRTFFCPTCGTSVYWETAKHPGGVGVAVGAFADPCFPPPSRSVWEQSAHAWVAIAPAAQHLPRGRGG
ncbi:MAG: GFA family protein [Hyphomonadaceae bacterium]